MASYIPNCKVPLENILQEMDYARGRSINPNVDIVLPPYIIDSRVIGSVEHETADYTESYAKKCPTNSQRYFFHQKFDSLKPPKRSISVSTLLAYACQYRAVECIRVLMIHGAKPLQMSFLLKWTTTNEGEQLMEITEKPAIAFAADMFHKNDIKSLARSFKFFKDAEVDFGNMIEMRFQQLQQPKSSTMKTIQFKDVWECLEKEIEKNPGPTLVDAKANLKKIHSAYNTDKLEQLYEKSKPKQAK